jgi:hypothetical protein
VSLFWQLGRVTVITIIRLTISSFCDLPTVLKTKGTRPEAATMAILFLLFLLHATLTSATQQLTKQQSDYYSSANASLDSVLVFPVLDQIQSVDINQSTDPKIRFAVHDGHADGNAHHHGIHVASWRWDEIGIYITFTTFIIVAGLAKVGNNSSPCPDRFCDKESFVTQERMNFYLFVREVSEQNSFHLADV